MQTIALTQVVRRLLANGLPESAKADLLFLEGWERDPQPGLAAARRVGQIRRAQPSVAAAIRAELEACYPTRQMSSQRHTLPREASLKAGH